MSTPRLCSTGLGRRTKKVRSGGTVALETVDPRGSLDTDRSTEPPVTPRSACQNNNSSEIADVDEWVKISVNEAALVCRIDFSGLLHNFGLTFFRD